VAELNGGVVKTFTVTPDELGIAKADPATLKGGECRVQRGAFDACC